MFEIMNNEVKIEINGFQIEVKVKEYKGYRVVTLADIDRLHNRPEGTARKRFNQNKKHLIIGVDYFVLNKDEAKKEFDITAPNGLILLTESGYLMIVKSFRDELSWQVQRQLVNGYFRAYQIQEQNKNSAIDMNMIMDKVNAFSEEFSMLKEKFDKLSKENEQLKQENEKLKQEIKKSNQKIKESDKKFTEIIKLDREDIIKFKEQISELSQKIYMLTKDKFQISEQIKYMKEEERRLNKEKLKLNKKIKTLNSQFTSIIKKNCEDITALDMKMENLNKD